MSQRCWEDRGVRPVQRRSCAYCRLASLTGRPLGVNDCFGVIWLQVSCKRQRWLRSSVIGPRRSSGWLKSHAWSISESSRLAHIETDSARIRAALRITEHHLKLQHSFCVRAPREILSLHNARFPVADQSWYRCSVCVHTQKLIYSPRTWCSS